MAEGRIIYNPGEAVIKMFKRKMSPESREMLDEKKFNAIGVFQTSVASVLFYADRVVKVSNVLPVEISGSCPQHITTLAFFGETTAVETAMKAIVADEKNRTHRFI